MRGHADEATLAAFREELLSARKAAQVSAHLAACPQCAALEAQLAEVTSVLHRATAPPMPDALTARIEAAIAAEAAARAAGTASVTAAVPAAVPAVPVAAGRDGTRSLNGRRTGDTAERHKGWRGHDRSWLALRVAAVTAAVAVIAGGGYGVSQLLSGGGPAMTGAASSAASGAGAGAPNIKVKGPVPGISAGGSNARSGTGSSTHSNAGTFLPLVISSGTNYQPSRLGAQASAVLAHLAKQKSATAQPVPNMAPAQNQATLFPDLQSCLIHIGRGQQPELVDLAHFQGHPALIVVLPGTNGANPRALAVAPGCNGTIAHVLASAPLPHAG